MWAQLLSDCPARQYPGVSPHMSSMFAQTSARLAGSVPVNVLQQSQLQRM
jgi:hypothetical protein